MGLETGLKSTVGSCVFATQTLKKNAELTVQVSLEVFISTGVKADF